MTALAVDWASRVGSVGLGDRMGLADLADLPGLRRPHGDFRPSSGPGQQRAFLRANQPRSFKKISDLFTTKDLSPSSIEWLCNRW